MYHPKRLHITRAMEEQDEEQRDVLKQMETIEVFEQRQIAHELEVFKSDIDKGALAKEDPVMAALSQVPKSRASMVLAGIDPCQ